MSILARDLTCDLIVSESTARKAAVIQSIKV